MRDVDLDIEVEYARILGDFEWMIPYLVVGLTV